MAATQSKPVSLNDVAAHLAQTEDPIAASPPNSFELSEGTLKFAAAGGLVERPETLLEPDPTTDPSLPTATHISNWALRDNRNNDMVVEVDADEREIYLKAVLFDRPVVFDIPVLDGRMVVKVRTLDEEDEAVVTAAVRIADTTYRTTEGLTEKQAPTSMMLYVTWVQRFKTLLRVESYTLRVDADAPVVTKQMSQLSVTDPDKDVRAKALCAHADAVFGKMNPALYTALITAVRIAEIKFTICSTKAASRNFWSPVGTN
jgi:hypothetical protein